MSILQLFVASRVKDLIGSRLMGRRMAAQKPVIEIPLRTPPGCNVVQRFRLLYERLGLPPFDALAEEVALPQVHGQLRFRNAWRQS